MIIYSYPTDINASAGLMGTLEYVNIVTDGWISNMILIALYCIALFTFYKASGDFAGALGVSGFFVFVIALLFWLANFINAITFGVVIAMAIIGVLVLVINKN